jgi:microcystin-dependent protein
MEDIHRIVHNIETLKIRSNYNAFYTLPHVGDYKFSARTADFHGWLKCNGAALNIADFPQLYAIIGTTFGNNGAGTFRLPNASGRVPGAIGTSTAGNHTLGQAIGAETHTLTIDEMPTHNHTITDPGHIHSGDTFRSGTQNVNNVAGADNAADEGVSTDNVDSAFTGITINNRGGNQAHNNMQPTIYIGSLFIFGGVFSDVVDPIVP